MKKLIPCLLLALISLSTSYTVYAQWQPGKVYDGKPDDSVMLSFSTTDTLINDTTKFYIGRTANDSLWQIGNTQKSFFSAGGFANRGIMTDTTNHYPVNANSSFVVFLDEPYHYYFNAILSFRHKFETTQGLDGGIVEFSSDTGKTWNNVRGNCTVDSTFMPGIRLENFYTDNDTLPDGSPAFTGVSNGWQYSRLQFFVGLPVRATGGANCIARNIQIRFRFVSDTTADTLDGWIIDDIKIEQDDYGSSVGTVKNSGALNVYPNPTSGVVNFPTLPQQVDYRIELYNVLGVKVSDLPYQNKVDISNCQQGIYFYKVTNGEHLYTGRLMID